MPRFWSPEGSRRDGNGVRVSEQQSSRKDGKRRSSGARPLCDSTNKQQHHQQQRQPLRKSPRYAGGTLGAVASPRPLEQPVTAQQLEDEMSDPFRKQDKVSRTPSRVGGGGWPAAADERPLSENSRSPSRVSASSHRGGGIVPSARKPHSEEVTRLQEEVYSLRDRLAKQQGERELLAIAAMDAESKVLELQAQLGKAQDVDGVEHGESHESFFRLEEEVRTATLERDQLQARAHAATTLLLEAQVRSASLEVAVDEVSLQRISLRKEALRGQVSAQCVASALEKRFVRLVHGTATLISSENASSVARQEAAELQLEETRAKAARDVEEAAQLAEGERNNRHSEAEAWGKERDRLNLALRESEAQLRQLDQRHSQEMAAALEKQLEETRAKAARDVEEAAQLAEGERNDRLSEAEAWGKEKDRLNLALRESEAQLRQLDQRLSRELSAQASLLEEARRDNQQLQLRLQQGGKSRGVENDTLESVSSDSEAVSNKPPRAKRARPPQNKSPVQESDSAKPKRARKATNDARTGAGEAPVVPSQLEQGEGSGEEAGKKAKKRKRKKATAGDGDKEAAATEAGLAPVSSSSASWSDEERAQAEAPSPCTSGGRPSRAAARVAAVAIKLVSEEDAAHQAKDRRRRRGSTSSCTVTSPTAAPSSPGVRGGEGATGGGAKGKKNTQVAVGEVPPARVAAVPTDEADGASASSGQVRHSGLEDAPAALSETDSVVSGRDSGAEAKVRARNSEKAPSVTSSRGSSSSSGGGGGGTSSRIGLRGTGSLLKGFRSGTFRMPRLKRSVGAGGKVAR